MLREADLDADGRVSEQDFLTFMSVAAPLHSNHL